MPRAFTVSIALLAFAGGALADLPTKPPLSKYSSLWRDSPFTSKPIVEGPGEAVNRINDYALAGVSPIDGGYRVTLLNKKTPDEPRVVIWSDRPSDWKILSVSRKAGDSLGTTVKVRNGKDEGTVTYDEKLMTLVQAAAPVAPQNQNQQGGQPQAQNMQQPPGVGGQPGAQGAQRPPRPRVVPPPNPQAGGQPQQQPVQQVQQQGQRSNIQEQRQFRPNRRGNNNN